MEISPRELRDAEIPDSFRGYNRDTVDEFLERAAATIEALQERNRQLTERLQAALAAAETAAKQAAAAPAPAPAPEPTPAPVVEAPAPPPPPEPVWVAPTPEPVRAEVAVVPDDLIQRTLITAQKAADQTIADADAYALKTKEDANRIAAETIAGANREADEIEAERRADLDRALVELENRRLELESGLDTLERFDADYRARLRSAIEADLQAIERRPVLAPGARPAISALTVEALESSEPAALDAGDEDATEGEPTRQTEAVAEVVDDALLDLDAAVDASDDRDELDDLDDDEDDGADVASDALDDDEFFASLRDAVHDDAPLGPRDSENKLFPRE